MIVTSHCFSAHNVDDDVPELEESEVPELEEAGEAAAAGGDSGTHNRAEKKSRKAMQKLGMRPIPGIYRMSVKKSNQVLFVINRPDVYKSPTADTYVIFGEAKTEDSGQMAAAAQQVAMAQQAQAAAQAAGAGPASAAPTLESVSEDAAAAEPAGDEEGVEAKDIELVMSQAGCSRAKAVKALKENDMDLVNAIMSLTT